MVKGGGNSIRIQTALLILILSLIEEEASKFKPTYWPNESLTMAYVDGWNREPDTEIDTFFDRVVSIVTKLSSNSETPTPRSAKVGHSRMYSNEATGVLFDANRVLTSNNAFKVLSEDSQARTQLFITILQDRLINETGEISGYIVNLNATVVCARQVIPPDPNEKVPPDLKHGVHSPLHDLMVIRLNKNITFLSPPKDRVRKFKNWKYGTWSEKYLAYENPMGPVLTELAKEGDELTENLMFASIGHVNDRHIEVSRYLEKEEVLFDDNVVMDCDEWIPRSWGYFICIKNVNNYPGIASGGLLFSEEKLFGIGSFALFKEDESVLVFTDVRPYDELLSQTCLHDDQNLVVPKDEL